MTAPYPPSYTATYGAGDNAATLQDQLNARGAAGGGTLFASNPGGSIKCDTGLTIPAGVTLQSDSATAWDFSGLAPGHAAITVHDSYAVPLRGLALYGPNTTASTTDTTTGISISGARNAFYDLRVKNFGTGIDLTHDDTYINHFVNGIVESCGTCVRIDLYGAGSTNSGEKTTFEHYTVCNSPMGFYATGNGLDLHLISTSIDFCDTFGHIRDAWVYFTNCHLETGGSGGSPYLFDVQANSHVFIDQANILMFSTRSGGLYNVFNHDEGPWNYSYGRAAVRNSTVYYSDPVGAHRQVFSEDLISWPAGTTTLTYYTPWPLRWSPVRASFCTTDGYAQTADDHVLIAVDSVATGQLTLTSGASSSSDRWVLLAY